MVFAMAFCSAEYFQNIDSLQKSIHEREKRRHELEENLFAYSRSEERLAKQKCKKMQHYLEELQKREQQAKARNLQLLRHVEGLILKAKDFSVDYTLLHCLKRNNLRQQSESLTPSTEQSLSQPAVISMGWQTLKDTLVEDGVMSEHSPTELITNHPPASQPQSSLLMNARVSKASSSKALSDDIRNSNDFPERQAVFDCGSFMGEGEMCGSKRLAEPHITLKASEECSHHRSLNRPESRALLQNQPSQSRSQDTTHARSFSVCRNSGEQATAEAESKFQLFSDEAKSRGSSILSSNGDISPEPGMDAQSTTPLYKINTQNRLEYEEILPAMPIYRLSMDEFFYLLDSIEERLSAGCTELYSSTAVSEQRLSEIISLCRQRGQLYSTELNVCGAVILQQLPWLLWNTTHGCLLHNNLVNTQWSTAVNSAQIRSSLSGDAATLWERCFTHALHLLRQEVLPLNSIVQLFTPLLVHYNASYTDKAEELLKRLLTHAAETSAFEDEEPSSCYSPSLNDRVQIEMVKPSKENFDNTGTEVQSGEEDSADQSSVESIPIRETKAYQLLKQSVTQEKQWKSTHEEDDGSDSEPSEDFPDLNNIQSVERQKKRNDTKLHTQGFSAVQSKAFWGDSDDSSSEIEKALRPQSHNVSNSDCDDFYD